MAPRRKLTDAEIKAAADRAEGKVTPADDPSTDKKLHPGGRPTEYQRKYAKQARKLCRLGATDIEIADFFCIDVATLYRWRLKFPEFCEALTIGKEQCDERVVRSLYGRAVGYTFDSEKIFQHQGEPVRVRTREHVPPETGAAFLWLKNRRPDLWRDKSEHVVDFAIGDRLDKVLGKGGKKG